MFWELYQQSSISVAHSKAQQASDTARGVDREQQFQKARIDRLEKEVQRQHLILMTMTEFLREKLGISDDELATRIAEIDMRDGQLDGQLKRPPTACPSCHHPNHAQRTQCLYCGTELPTPVV